MTLRNSEKIWVLALFLGVTGMLAALILAVTSRLTAEPIRQAMLRNELKMLKELDLPDFDNDMTADVFTVGGVEYMAASCNGKIVGFAARAQNNSGYSGLLKSLISFDVNGNILAVHTKDGGKMKVNVDKRYTRATELFSGSISEIRDGSFIYDFASPDTAVFRLD